MEKLNIKAEKREKVGKHAKELLEIGQIPAVIYNSKTESHNIKIEKGGLEAILPQISTTSIVEIELDGKKYNTVVKELQKDVITDEYKHVAFFEIDTDKIVHFSIPIVTEGVSPAVKNNLGILVQSLTHIDVKCKLENLISEIVLDVTELLKPGDGIKVSEIDLPEGVELLRKSDSALSVLTIANLQKIVETKEEETDEDEEREEGAEGEEKTEGKEETEGTEGEKTEKDSAEKAE